MDPIKPVLAKLERDGAHIVYNTVTKQAILFHSDPGNIDPGSPLPQAELLALFERSWITRYDSRGSEHHYRITEAGRRANRE